MLEFRVQQCYRKRQTTLMSERPSEPGRHSEEAEARCEALERSYRRAIAELAESRAQLEASRRDAEATRRQFDERIAELRTLLEALRPATDRPAS